MTLFLLLSQVTLITLAAFIAVKMFSLRKSFKRSQSIENVRLTQQLESLDRLYYRLDLPRGSLPPSRGWAASPDFLNVLYEEVVKCRPRIVVECGSGLSTIVTARALQQLGGGKILSLEHDELFAGLTLDNLRLLGLDEYADICVAPLVNQTIGETTHCWYDLQSVEIPLEIDFITVDGPPEPLVGPRGRYAVGPALFSRLSNGGIVLFDDASRPGEKILIEQLMNTFEQFDKRDVYTEKGCTILKKNH